MAIKVQIDGFDDPVEFADETPMETIQAKVKELVAANPKPEPQSPDFIGSMGGTGAIVDTVSAAREGIKEEGPAIVGGTALGLAAAASGPVSIPMMGLYVALGAAGGEGYKQLGQQLAGSASAPKTSMEAAKNIAKVGAREGGTEILGGLVAKGVGKLLSPFSKSVTKETLDAVNSLKGKIGPIVLTPAEMTDSRALDILQNISESSIMGGGVLQSYKTERNRAFDEIADGLIDQFGTRTDPTELGELFVANIEAKRKVHATAAEILYNQVDEIIGPPIEKVTVKKVGTGLMDKSGKEILRDVEEKTLQSPVRVSTESLKDFAKKVRSTSEGLGNIEAKNAGDDLVDAILDMPKEVDWQVARELRSRLRSRIDEYSVINKKAPAIGKARKMMGLIDTEIEGALKGFKGREVTEEEISTMIQSSVDEIIKKDPSINIPSDINTGESLWYTCEDFATNLQTQIPGSTVVSDESHAFLKVGNKYFDSETPLGVYDPSELPTFRRLGEEFYEPRAIFTKSKTVPPSALDAWRTANQFYKEGQEEFNNTMIRRLVKLADETGTGAEMIAPQIFQPGKISRVRKVKQAVSPQTWGKMKGFFMQNLMQKSTSVDGMVMGKRLLNNISGKPNSFGEPMLREVLSEPQLQSLKNFATVLEKAQAKQAEGAGRMVIQFTQMGALATMAMGDMTVPATTIILGPPVVGKMMLNPHIAKWLTEGVALPAGSERAAGLLSRIVGASVRLSRGDNND